MVSGVVTWRSDLLTKLIKMSLMHALFMSFVQPAPSRSNFYLQRVHNFLRILRLFCNSSASISVYLRFQSTF